MIESQDDSQGQKRGGRLHENDTADNPVLNEAQRFDSEKAQSCAPVAETDQTLSQVK